MTGAVDRSIVLGLWGLDQYLHWQAAQGRQASPAPPPTTVSIQIDFARPLLPVAVLVAVTEAPGTAAFD